MGQGRRRAAKQINTPRTQLKTVLMTGVCLATGHSSRAELRVISFDHHLPWDPECLWTVSASLRHPSGTAHLPLPTQGAAGCPHGGSRAGSRALEEPSGLQGLPMPRGRSRPDRVGAGRACRRHAGPAWGLRSREHCGHLRPGLRITALSASVRQPSAETPLPRDPGPGPRVTDTRNIGAFPDAGPSVPQDPVLLWQGVSSGSFQTRERAIPVGRDAPVLAWRRLVCLMLHLSTFPRAAGHRPAGRVFTAGVGEHLAPWASQTCA